jgi:hypothetical protein
MIQPLTFSGAKIIQASATLKANGSCDYVIDAWVNDEDGTTLKDDAEYLVDYTGVERVDIRATSDPNNIGSQFALTAYGNYKGDSFVRSLPPLETDQELENVTDFLDKLEITEEGVKRGIRKAVEDVYFVRPFYADESDEDKEAARKPDSSIKVAQASVRPRANGVDEYIVGAWVNNGGGNKFTKSIAERYLKNTTIDYIELRGTTSSDGNGPDFTLIGHGEDASNSYVIRYIPDSVPYNGPLPIIELWRLINTLDISEAIRQGLKEALHDTYYRYKKPLVPKFKQLSSVAKP